MRKGSKCVEFTVLACELPWYLKRRDVVSSWRAYKQSTHSATAWLPAEKWRKDKKKKGKKEPVVEEAVDYSDSEGSLLSMNLR